MSDEEADAFPPFKPPKQLGLDVQIPMCIGHLVAEWANCETIFRSIYVCLVGRSSTEARDFAEVAWLSFTSTKARCDLLLRITNSAEISQAHRTEILRLIDRFISVSASRNFYCHAYYAADASGNLTAVEGYTLTRTEEVLRFDRRPADRTLVAALCTVIANCQNLNRQACGLLDDLHKATKALFPELPVWPDGYLPTKAHRQPGTAQKP